MTGVQYDGLTCWELVVKFEDETELLADCEVWGRDINDAMNCAEFICNRRYGNSWVSYTLI